MSYEQLAAELADRYRLERELGRGGMAVVFLAHDLKHSRQVAVKVLHPEFGGSSLDDRFFREIGIAARLAHPNILPLHDSGRAAGRLFYVTPYLEGESLRAWLERERRLPADVAIGLAAEIADALDYAHRQGVIHRDIKPDNILISDGHAIVADFGIATALAADEARLTNTGIALGTPRYMSPEQALADKVDGRSDIYSLACVLYESLAGEPPTSTGFGLASGSLKTSNLARTLNAAHPSFPRHVVAAIQRGLAPLPDHRYQRAGDFKRALLADPHAASRRSQRWIATGTGTAILIAAGVMLFRPQTPAGPTRLEYTPLTNFAESATSPALSPDGRMLAFILGESTFFGPGQIYIKLLPDGEPVQLTHDDLYKMGPKFTPDGASITYTVLGAAGWDTWVVPVLGGEPRLLLTNAEGLTWIDTGAGAPRVLFSEVTGRDVQMAIVTSAENRAQPRTVYLPPVTGMAHRSYLSPDRRHVLLIEMDYYSWLPCRLTPFHGSSPGKPVGPVPAQCTDASWSPDGKWMYFSANAGTGFHIWRQRFPDGAPEQVTSGVTEEEGIELSPDGRSFVTSIGTRQATIWVHDHRGDRQITSEGFAMLPSISSDGKKLYYLVRAGGTGSYISGSLWVVDLESGQRRRLLPDFLMQTYDISADGGRVVFVAADDSTRSPLWLAALDGRSAPRRLVRNDALQAFFGAEGDVIFAVREREQNFIYGIREDGSELRKVKQASNLVNVSPDGQWIAVGVAAATDEMQQAVIAYRIGGGSPILICGKCGPPPSFERGPWPPQVSWSPDGRFLYLDLYGSPYAIPLQPGQALPRLPATGLRTGQEVAALPGARPLPQERAFTGPNPDLFAFTKVTVQRNIYRVPVP
ncbi:MAG: protein kinase domain-containing protein [Gemmatimonadaceae bacterium]